jgi:hypothetical protein
VTLQVFLLKIAQKLANYWGAFAGILIPLPKKMLAKPLVLLFGRFYCPTLNQDTSESSRVKPHILILRNKYYTKNSEQVSTEQFHLDCTLKASGRATFDVLTYDDDLQVSPLSDFKFIKTCGAVRPDAIVFSSWWDSARQPSVHAIRYVSHRLGIRVGAIWWDTCSDKFWVDVQQYRDLFDVHVVIDNPKLHCLIGEEVFRKKILQLWAPQDHDKYFPREMQNVPVSFIGQVSDYRSYRSEVISYLLENGISGSFQTNSRDKQISHAEYAEQIGRSAMSINFSYSVNCHQLKSRVFEVLFSGALLLESENDQTKSMFVPMRDYVPFTSKEDLMGKVKYYLGNEQERAAIASQGRKTAMQLYHSDFFWERFLTRLTGVSASQI